ncbi:MAG TPA: DUF4870 domain-containing protein [Pyrinomonadaceae bacterium]|nr:DUF4870 domain-containing protein [Pyrinomonadaceae bacterium]
MNYEMQYRPPTNLQTAEERQMGLYLHLSQLANVFMFPIGIVIPIILWQTQKQNMPALDAHGKMVVNWLISSAIYMIVSVFLMFFLIGIPLVIALAIIGIVFPIVGAVKANNGELWDYPLAIKFIK